MLLLVGLCWHAVGHQQAAQIRVEYNTIVACWALFGMQSVTDNPLRYVQNTIQSLLVGLFWVCSRSPTTRSDTCKIQYNRYLLDPFWYAVGHQQAAQIRVKYNTIVACWTLLVSCWSPRSRSDTCKMQCNRYLLDSFGIQSVTNKLLRYV